MASDQVTLEVRRLIRRGEINEAIDTFIEVLDEDFNLCSGDCDGLNTTMKTFKKHVLPVLRLNYKSCRVLLKISHLLLISGEESRSLRYFKRTLDFFKIYLTNCENTNGLMSFEFRIEVIDDFIKLGQERGTSDFILNGLKDLLEIVEPNSTHVPDILQLNEIIAEMFTYKKEHKKALKSYRKAYKLIRNNWEWKARLPKLLNDIGKCHESMENYELAIKTFEKNISETERPDLKIFALFRLGHCLFYHVKDYNKAKTTLLDILRIVVREHKTKKPSGEIYSQTDDLPAVVDMLYQCYEKLGLKKIDDGSWKTVQNLKDFNQISTMIESKKEHFIEPTCRSMYAMRFWSFMEAWIMLLKQECFVYNNWKIYHAKAMCYCSCNCRNYEGIIETKKAIEHCDDEKSRNQFKWMLIKLYNNFHFIEFEDALECLQTVSNPEEHVIHTIGVYLRELQRSREAVKLCSENIMKGNKNSKKFVDFIILRAQSLLQLQEHSMALNSLDIIDVSSKSHKNEKGEYFLIKGHVLMRLERHSEAQKCLLISRHNFNTEKCGSVDSGIVTLVLLVLNSLKLGTNAKEYIENIFKLCSEEGRFLVWALRMCSREEKEAFYRAYFPFTKSKFGRGNTRYRNSVQLSNVFRSVRNRDLSSYDIEMKLQ